MSFKIVRNDITKVTADAIVNTANPKVAYGGGVDRAIYKAAGEKKLLAERAKIGVMKPGELDVLEICYEKCLKKAYSLKCKSIAFPLISTGVYGFPKDKGLQIAMSVLQDGFTILLSAPVRLQLLRQR